MRHDRLTPTENDVQYAEPVFLHSTTDEGRHWLTTAEILPLQIWPVAANHCRTGHFIARVVRAKLAPFAELPPEVVLTHEDVLAVPELTQRYPELAVAQGTREVRVRLAMQRGPERVASEQDTEESAVDTDGESEDEIRAEYLKALEDLAGLEGFEDLAQLKSLADLGNDAATAGGLTEFVTPLPPEDWEHSYDDWIATAARDLGLDAPPARDKESYDDELAKATAAVRRRLPAIRERIVAGMNELLLALKIGLTTSSGGTEFVWARVLDWSDATIAKCKLESAPRDCPGYRHGQRLDVAVAEVIDYVIGSEEAGVLDPGLTERIAEDYGLMVT